jgi:hypothetical protein
MIRDPGWRWFWVVREMCVGGSVRVAASHQFGLGCVPDNREFQLVDDSRRCCVFMKPLVLQLRASAGRHVFQATAVRLKVEQIQLVAGLD